jgi:hypothetical protein
MRYMAYCGIRVSSLAFSSPGEKGRSETYTGEQRRLDNTEDESNGHKAFVVLDTSSGCRYTRPDDGTEGKIQARSDDGYEHVGRELAKNVTDCPVLAYSRPWGGNLAKRGAFTRQRGWTRQH